MFVYMHIHYIHVYRVPVNSEIFAFHVPVCNLVEILPSDSDLIRLNGAAEENQKRVPLGTLDKETVASGSVLLVMCNDQRAQCFEYLARRVLSLARARFLSHARVRALLFSRSLALSRARTRCLSLLSLSLFL